jgi:hypothetical protein
LHYLCTVDNERAAQLHSFDIHALQVLTRDMQSKERVVMFDKNNAVTRFTMRESQQEVVRGAGPRKE